MGAEDSPRSGPQRPCLEAKDRCCDGILAAGAGGCEPVRQVDESQLVGVRVMVDVASMAPVAMDAVMKTEVKVEQGSGVKRKRGRPPGRQSKPATVSRKKEEEEDVCFICFDGGCLVLCDRRGCPKAYHPACVKRDEAFFRSRAKWNCGWHICSSCQKASHYMCYTCTYSLCKACTKGADYVCVRENKGFCNTCLKTIMLIENSGQGNKEMVQVDFDDKSSWEYLFKVYWIYLKGKLSLTLDELTQAQNPWKAASAMACEGQTLNVNYGVNTGKVSITNSPYGRMVANNSKRRRTKEQSMLPNKGDPLSMEKSVNTNGRIQEWASNELLEFVAHERNGDTSMLSQFDVECLVQNYIKRNNLRDPRQKSQIICDLRLRNLFGKPRLGHFEMLKLLEYHFLAKEDSQKDVLPGNIVDAVVSQVEGNGDNDKFLMMAKDKKRKTRKKGEERVPQRNLDEYAAIDIHNINLIYLRRELMESLILDDPKFQDKVVGSIVRKRISGSEPKHDIYRLVQVTGTCMVEVPYKVGERTSDIMLEILNLNRKETISIDSISNQDFSEDECRRLRQSIKFGLVGLLTVGQVQKIATALQEVKLNDRLKAEIMRLNHLRDRASEKGHRKELRECIEKLELLKTPEERHRRLHEIPEIHADPNMDPNWESDEDVGVISNMKQGEYEKPRYSEMRRNTREVISPQNDGVSNDSGSRIREKLPTYDLSRRKSYPFYLDKGDSSWVAEGGNESSWNEGKSACGSNAFEKPNQVDSCSSVVGGWNNQPGLRSRSLSGVGSETSVASHSIGSAPSVNDGETEKVWHYRDPNGKVQGPFCVVQLRKWNTSGYFPTDMRVWNINDEECDSSLLTDVLNGQFHKVSAQQSSISLPSPEVQDASDSRLSQGNGKWNSNTTNSIDINSTVANLSSTTGLDKDSHSSNCITPVVNYNDAHAGTSSQCWASPKVQNSYHDQTEVHCLATPSTSAKQSHETSLHHSRMHKDQIWNSTSNAGNVLFETSGKQSRHNQTDSQDCLEQSSRESQRPLPTKNSAYHWDSSERNFGIDVPNVANPTPKSCNVDLEGQNTKDEQKASADTSAQALSKQNLPSITPKLNDGEEKVVSGVQNKPGPLPKPADDNQKGQATENTLPVSSFSVQDLVPRWTCASSPAVDCGTRLPEMVDQWGGNFSTRAKTSIKEWDPNLLSIPSLNPLEPARDNTAAIDKCDRLASLPSHLTCNISSWQDLVNEPIEFSTLAEESVSDLLAEVDAMESQCGLPSPTSVMNCDDELFEDSKTDCFTALGLSLSPPRDSGKSDALSSSGDMQFPQPIIKDEPLGSSGASILNPVKSDGLSSTSTDMQLETKAKPAFLQLPIPSIVNLDITGAEAAPRVSRPVGSGGTSQGNLNLNRGGSIQGITTMGWETGQWVANGYANTNHPKYTTDRLVSPREWGFQSDAGFGRGRSSWSRQPPFGGSVGSTSRHSPKGQRLCKFYRSGHCKKGTSCAYLHL